MQQFTDDLGIPYTATESGSMDSFNQVLESYLESRSYVMPELDKLLRKDASMPMAHCLRAYLIKLASDPRLLAPIQAESAYLASITDQMNDRERQHLLALDALIANQSEQAINILDSLLEQYPRDMLALRLNHHLHFYSGVASNLKNSVSLSVQHWGSDEPFYSFLLGMHSFGLEEAADYELAETTGRQAVELNSNDLWAAHAVAHVMQMQGRYAEGVAWLAALLPTWKQTNNFIYHLHWHKALFHIGLSDHQAALGIYDEYLLDPLVDDFYLDICNGASLLWRLEMHGVDVGDRWQALASYSAARVQDDELVFCTLHYLMTPARLQDKAITQRALDHFESWSERDTTQGAVAKKVGLPLARAVVDLGRGEFELAAQTIQVIQDEIVAIGGSHAQRHLFDQMQSFARQRT